MRIFKTGLITVFFITGILTLTGYAADSKIGVFDFEQIMKDSKIGKSAQSKLEKKHKSLAAVLEKKKDELERMDTKLEKDRMVMGQDKYTKEKYEIQKKAIDFKELERKSTDEMRQLRQELIAEINKDVIEIIGKIGKKENYLLIMEKTMAGVAYYPKSIDLTDKIIKEMNSK